MHGYFHKKLQQDQNIDMKGSQLRCGSRQMSSHIEGYLGAIQEQEIPTKYLQRKLSLHNGYI